MLARNRWFDWSCVAPLGLALLACGGDGPVQAEPPTEPPAEPLPSPAAIAFVSGDGQEGKAGESLPEPFVVQVTDAGGDGVEGVEVTWRVTSGAGWLQWLSIAARDESLVTATDPGGVATVVFQPTMVGTSTVAAEVSGLEASPVTFTADATVAVITFVLDPIDGVWFSGPAGSSDVTVPAGTTVEWVVRGFGGLSGEVRIASTSEPPGGEPFDSGTLSPSSGNRALFEFVPGVAGTWEFEGTWGFVGDHGSTGTLTAH